MAIEVPDIPVTGTVIESAWGADVANSIAELDPSGASPGQVLKVNSASDGYDFGGAMMIAEAGAHYSLPLNASTVQPSTSGSTNTYGSYAEVEDSLSEDSYCIGVTAISVGNDATFIGYNEVEIAVGASASEVPQAEIVVPGHFHPSSATKVGFYVPLGLPIFIAAGSRIAVRVRSEYTDTSNVRIKLHMVKKDEVVSS